MLAVLVEKLQLLLTQCRVASPEAIKTLAEIDSICQSEGEGAPKISQEHLADLRLRKQNLLKAG
jgi:hypothetical protein